LKQIIIYLATPTMGGAEISGESWQLVTAFLGEGDGLILFVNTLVMTTLLLISVLVLLELTHSLPSQHYSGVLSGI
jgi:hypothetical protein